MDTTPEYQKAASDIGSGVTLKCRATGAPSISFTWGREGEKLTPGDVYSIETKKVRFKNLISITFFTTFIPFIFSVGRVLMIASPSEKMSKVSMRSKVRGFDGTPDHLFLNSAPNL
jgi:hypothetical protein